MNVTIYVGDIIAYLGQNPFETFDERMKERVEFWLNGPTKKKPAAEKNKLIQYVDSCKLEEFDKLLKHARFILDDDSFSQVETYVSRASGKRMENKAGDIGIREALIRRPIITHGNINYMWSVRVDGLLTDHITEVKTRSRRACSSNYYPSEYTQMQIYMHLADVDYCNFIEYVKKPWGLPGYDKTITHVERDDETWYTIEEKTFAMINEIHDMLVARLMTPDQVDELHLATVSKLNKLLEHKTQKREKNGGDKNDDCADNER